MSGDPLPLLEVPDWVDHVVTDLAIAIATGALLSYLVFVVPGPEPLLTLPAVLTLEPFLWVLMSLSVLCLPFLGWFRVGERVATWWEDHVE